MSTPRWTEDRTAQLEQIVANVEAPISREVVEQAAESLETSSRSVSSKLRKLGYDVAKVQPASRAFSEEQEAALESFVTDNSGQLTYAEIAEQFEGGAFRPQVIQGKLLSMELTGHVKPAEKKVAPRTYTPDQEATFIQMANAGNYLEEIAASLDKTVAQVRGKALSLLRSGDIEAIPTQRDRAESASKGDPLEGLDVGEMTVDQIAEAIDKTPRGVRSMLTRRGVTCADYDGAAKREKREAAATAE